MPHSDEISILAQLISDIRSGQVMAELSEARDHIAGQYQVFEHLMAAETPPQIYGVNTLPGHREGDPIPANFASSYQRNLIHNHCLPQTEFVDGETAHFIHLAKCLTVSAGGALISPDLYDILVDLCAEPGFAPQIPAGASYSSGDVIPAAYWARSVLAARPYYELNPGEGMALINGAFVHIGTALAGFSRLEKVWTTYLDTTRQFLMRVPANDAFLTHASHSRVEAALHFITGASRYPAPGDLQPPVSVRAIPQTLSAFHTSITGFARELLASLSQPSSNPRIGETGKGDARILPSGSFVAPSLSLATGQLIDSILMLGWTLVRRMEYFLSGQVEGVARDGTGPADPIGLIQWPKLAAAKLEHMRMLNSRRVFASGGATSYGVEDFWTHGVIVTQQLSVCLDTLMDILQLEQTVQREVRGESSGRTDETRERRAAGVSTLLEAAGFLQFEIRS
jgi:histidine ammonia-lyase